MDSVLADFSEAAGIPRGTHSSDPAAMYVPGFFRKLAVMPGAKKAVEKLSKMGHIDLYIASKPPYKNPLSYTEKAQWVKEHFPLLQSKIFLTCDKSHLNGDYLIDDDPVWIGKFGGTVLKFDETKSEECWNRIVEFFNVDVFNIKKGA